MDKTKKNTAPPENPKPETVLVWDYISLSLVFDHRMDQNLVKS